MFFLRGIECGQLFWRGLGLMCRFPLRKRFAVDVFARGVFCHRDSLRVGGLAIPGGQAIPAETGQDHQVDVLYIGARRVQVREQATKRRGFEFDGFIRHDRLRDFPDLSAH